MASYPSSTVNFYHVDFPRDGSHVSDNASAIPSPIKTVSGYQYVHMGAPIEVGCKIEDLLYANYLMFRNPTHENKPIYAFITETKMRSENTTLVYFEVDPWQTYKNDIIYQNVFVEREHVSSDGIGEHVVPEGLEYGDLIPEEELAIMPGMTMRAWCIVGVTLAPVNPASNEVIFEDPINPNALEIGYKRKIEEIKYFLGIGGTTEEDPLHDYTGVEFRTLMPVTYGDNVSAIMFFAFRMDSIGFGKLQTFLRMYNKYGYTDQIVGGWVVNERLLIDYHKADITNYSSVTRVQSHNSIGYTETKTLNLVGETLNGYTPQNKKLLSYPYVQGYVHNGNGSSRVLKPEEFNNGTVSFRTIGYLLEPDPIIKLKIEGRKGANLKDEAMTLKGFPMMAWNNDLYTEWVAQNRNRLVANTLTGVTGAVVAPFTGGASLAVVAGTAASTANAVAETYDKMNQGSNFNGVMSGPINYQDYTLNFFAHRKTISAEYARIIDEYFKMYGYKVNRVKRPNVSGRASHNFVKVNGQVIGGAIPQIYKDKLNQMFNTGVTIWHGSTMYGYNLPNGIV